MLVLIAAILLDPADDRSAQVSSMSPRPPTEFVESYSVESAQSAADSPYPADFARQQNPGQMTLAEPSSQGSAEAWNPLARPCLHQSTSESRSPYNPSGSPYPVGFVPQQSPREMTFTFPSPHGSAGAWEPWLGSYSLQPINESHSSYSHSDAQVDRYQSPRPIVAAPLSQGPAGVPFSQALRQPSFPEHNRSFVAAKKRKALVVCNGQQRVQNTPLIPDFYGHRRLGSITPNIQTNALG